MLLVSVAWPGLAAAQTTFIRPASYAYVVLRPYIFDPAVNTCLWWAVQPLTSNLMTSNLPPIYLICHQPISTAPLNGLPRGGPGTGKDILEVNDPLAPTSRAGGDPYEGNLRKGTVHCDTHPKRGQDTAKQKPLARRGGT